MTPEQRQIAAARQVEVDQPVEEVLDLLRALLAFDAQMASRRKLAGWGIAAGAIVTVAGSLTVGWMGAVAGLVVLIASIALFVRFQSQDLSDNLGTAAIPFLAILRQDIDDGGPLSVKLDLRPHKDPDKLKSVGDPYKNGAYYKIVDRLYVDPWFSGGALLADGTKVRWNVTEHVLEQSKTKRSSRGKIKSKTKLHRKTVAAVTLSFPTKGYMVTGDAERDEKRAAVTLARKVKSHDVASPAFPLLVEMIAEGYRRVKVSA